MAFRQTHSRFVLASLFASLSLCLGQPATNALDTASVRFKSLEESLGFVEHNLARRISDLLWFQRLSDVAHVDKVRFTGPPSHVTNNPTAQDAGLETIVTAFTFTPRKFDSATKLPALIFVHGGVHANFDSDHDVAIVRELLDQGYVIIAPDYRGSTGYGKDYWQAIDYGGLENEDVFAARNWLIENRSNVDPQRVGILGWSHGGMITLMNIFDHPRDYVVAYAGVPVSDLVARMGYKGQGYRDLFSAGYHIGKTAEENVKEYRRRSPVWNAERLETPLLIHTTTNDEDVNVLEVQALINALKAGGKKFEHKIYTNAAGGHVFNRLDTKLAKESRAEIYRFLAQYLKPPNPPK